MASGGRVIDRSLNSAYVSGTPTLTTSTLTPTTLRQIQLALFSGSDPSSSEGQAGFIPPSVIVSSGLGALPSNVSSEDSSHGFTGSSSSECGSMSPAPPDPSQQSRKPSNGRNKQPSERRRGGGRRSGALQSPPHLGIMDDEGSRGSKRNYSGDSSSSSTTRGAGKRRASSPFDDSKLGEDDRKLLRRQRNKEAAARCRKRRLDTTVMLESETRDIEMKNQALENEIRMLHSQKDELVFLLEGHQNVCKLNATGEGASAAATITSNRQQSASSFVAKSSVLVSGRSDAPGPDSPPPEIKVSSKENCRVESTLTPSSADPSSSGCGSPRPEKKRLRPTSFTLQTKRQMPLLPSMTPETDLAGNPILTPSSSLPPSFDALTAGGTGLTPTPLTAITSVADIFPSLDTPSADKTIVPLGGPSEGGDSDRC